MDFGNKHYRELQKEKQKAMKEIERSKEEKIRIKEDAERRKDESKIMIAENGGKIGGHILFKITK